MHPDAKYSPIQQLQRKLQRTGPKPPIQALDFSVGSISSLKEAAN